MLSRTANELYWMARHIERAENTARLLDVTYRTSLLPYEPQEPGLAWAEPWAVPLISTGGATTFYKTLSGSSPPKTCCSFMILDAGNPSSIYCCLRAARESARSVRGAITSEMYEDLNGAWIEMRKHDYQRLQAIGVSEFLEWVKMRSHLFRGVTFGTMLRDEAYHFIRLGTHIERADNTARILDTKYHILLPSAADVGGAVDYYQWASLLQSLSGFESYRKIYSDVISPRRVAELLVLRDDMPRSLHSCLNFIDDTLEILCDDHSRELRRQAGELHARLHFGRTDDIIRYGLHEYLMDFLQRVSLLGDEDQPALPGAVLLTASPTRFGRMADFARSHATSVRRHHHDLLRCHVARRRDDLRVGFPHQRGRRPDRALFQDEGVRARKASASSSRCRRATCRSRRTRSTSSSRRRAAATTRCTCGTRSRCSTSRACSATALREVKTRDGPYLVQNNIDASRQLPRRRPDPRRAAAAVQRLRRGQLHRGHAGHLLLPDRRDEVRQADHRPRDQAHDEPARRDQVHDRVVRLDDALQHLGRAADRPARLRDRLAAHQAAAADRGVRSVLPDGARAVGRGAAPRVRAACPIPTGPRT